MLLYALTISMYPTLYQVSNDKPDNYSSTDDEYSDSFDTSNNDNGKKVVVFCSLVYCTT